MEQVSEIFLSACVYLFSSLMSGGWVAWVVGGLAVLIVLRWIYKLFTTSYDDLDSNVHDHLDLTNLSASSELEDKLRLKKLTAKEVMKLDKSKKKKEEKEF